MKPVLVDLGALEITSYGVSKVLAALVAGVLLARELRRHGRDPEAASGLVIAAVVGGFAGAKLHYLAEHADSLSLHSLGGSGFSWFGGLVGGALATIVAARRQAIPLSLMAGMAAAPLAFAYGVGRLGCLLAGDGTYGTPTDLPWAMSFPNGTMPTFQEVHPTPLYEALAAFAVGALLWRLRWRLPPLALFGLYAVLMGVSRFLVEFVRLNEEVLLGLSQPQLWSLALILLGLWAGWRAGVPRGLSLRRSRTPQAGLSASFAEPRPAEDAAPVQSARR